MEAAKAATADGDDGRPAALDACDECVAGRSLDRLVDGLRVGLGLRATSRSSSAGLEAGAAAYLLKTASRASICLGVAAAARAPGASAAPRPVSGLTP